MADTFDRAQWYTASEAAERLTRNSGRDVDVSYPRKLAQYGKIRSYALSDRFNLYYKPDVDVFIVEERGEKMARAKRQAAKPKPKKKTQQKKAGKYAA